MCSLFSYLHTNIAKGECKGKRNLHFRLGSTELFLCPTNIRISESGAKQVSSSFNSNIVKGECNGKRNLHFRLDSAEPYPIFYKDSEKRAEEKWPRFFILNHIVKRDGCFFNSRLVYNNRKENAFIRSPVYLTREYRLISCRIPKSCREGSETTYIELRILMFEE